MSTYQFSNSADSVCFDARDNRDALRECEELNVDGGPFTLFEMNGRGDWVVVFETK